MKGAPKGYGVGGAAAVWKEHEQVQQDWGNVSVLLVIINETLSLGTTTATASHGWLFCYVLP